jgi:hypothetical protein
MESEILSMPSIAVVTNPDFAVLAILQYLPSLQRFLLAISSWPSSPLRLHDYGMDALSRDKRNRGFGEYRPG